MRTGITDKLRTSLNWKQRADRAEKSEAHAWKVAAAVTTLYGVAATLGGFLAYRDAATRPPWTIPVIVPKDTGDIRIAPPVIGEPIALEQANADAMTRKVVRFCEGYNRDLYAVHAGLCLSMLNDKGRARYATRFDWKNDRSYYAQHGDGTTVAIEVDSVTPLSKTANVLVGWRVFNASGRCERQKFKAEVPYQWIGAIAQQRYRDENPNGFMAFDIVTEDLSQRLPSECPK